MSTLSAPIYCIPGMGTDRRIFDRLALGELNYVDWISPEKDEPLPAYAKRMAAQIPAGVVPLLIGVSFGGMIAIEISKIRPITQLILISSIKHKRELPLKFQLMKYLPLYELSRGSWRYKLLPYFAPLIGISDREEILLLQDMFAKFNDDYRMWSIRQIIDWQNEETDASWIHIHGTQDQVFPHHRITNATFIPKGDHFMIYREGQALSVLIKKMLNIEPNSP